jgi:ribonuclease P protein component
VENAFPFARRLHSPVEFKRALQHNSLTNKWVALHTEKNDEGYERLGIIVSKRLVAKAVARNRLKRTIREVFRQNYSDTGSALNVVVRIRRNISETDIPEFRRSLSCLLIKVRTI